MKRLGLAALVALAAAFLVSRGRHAPAVAGATPAPPRAQRVSPAPLPITLRGDDDDMTPPAAARVDDDDGAQPIAVAPAPETVAQPAPERVLHEIRRDPAAGPYLAAAEELEMSPAEMERVVPLLRTVHMRARGGPTSDDPAALFSRTQAWLAPQLNAMLGHPRADQLLDRASRQWMLATARR